MKKTALILFILGLFSFTYSQNTNFVRGADLSFTQQIEDLGGKYKINGIEKEVLDIFKENGVNYIRLRLWHTPKDGYCGLEKTISFAKRVKAKGLKFLLDLHYSDSWADPAKQTKPDAWKNLSYDDLKDSIYSYTKNILTAFKNQSAMPDMVQLGNEISNGMLWPDGKNTTSAGWTALGEFLKKGISGLRDAAGGIPVKIMLHIDCGGDNAKSVWWLDNIISQNVEFDVIGLSYYPWWQGTLSALEYNVNDLAARYGKEINIVETAYPWTLDWKDSETNIVGLQSQLLSSYPATVQGQKEFIIAVIRIVENIPNSKGNGFFYWAPDWISTNPMTSNWENLTLFDFNGEALSSIAAFNYGSASHTENIKSPVSFQLSQNYPNPFNPSTRINFTLALSGFTKLEVYNVLGEEVAVLINSVLTAGRHEVEFNTKGLPGGIYFYRLQSGTRQETRKMVFVK